MKNPTLAVILAVTLGAGSSAHAGARAELPIVVTNPSPGVTLVSGSFQGAYSAADTTQLIGCTNEESPTEIFISCQAVVNSVQYGCIRMHPTQAAILAVASIKSSSFISFATDCSFLSVSNSSENVELQPED
ncbi:MAG: hypothetical protein JSR66_02315 [Proteobacteria bacterium]|nr:hypothetical protein [Pseudomonadota bacterium]